MHYTQTCPAIMQYIPELNNIFVRSNIAGNYPASITLE